MCRGEAFFEQQPHRVALVTEGRLHADEHIAEALTKDKESAAVRIVPAGAGPHCRSISSSQRSRRT